MCKPAAVSPQNLEVSNLAFSLQKKIACLIDIQLSVVFAADARVDSSLYDVYLYPDATTDIYFIYVNLADATYSTAWVDSH